MYSKKHIRWIDISKGLAILMIVIGHVLKSGIVHNIVYYFHVPFFFFISGITAKSVGSKKQITKDFRRLMFPYYAFGIISILIYQLLGEFAGARLGETVSVSLLHNLGELIYGSCHNSALKFNRPLWFLPCLFVAKLFWYILNCIKNNTLFYALVFATVGSLFGFWYTGNDLYGLPFSIELMLKLFPFFFFGALLSPRIHSTVSSEAFHRTYLYIGILLFLFSTISAAFLPPVNYTSNTFPIPVLFYFIASSGCIGLCCISSALRAQHILEYLGKKSLSILVMHKFPIVFFQIIEPFQTMLNKPDSIAGIGCATAVTALTCALCLLANLILERFTPTLLGNSVSK